jgi:hypothetical protein
MAFWRCRRRLSGVRKIAAVLIRSGLALRRCDLSQKRTLKMHLKLRWGTRGVRKQAFQMREGLQQRIGVRAPGRLLLTAEASSQSVQTAPQFSAQLIEGLQRKGQAQLLRRGFEREPG